MLGMEEVLGVRQNIYLGVVLNYETKSKRNETKYYETQRNILKCETKRNATKRNLQRPSIVTVTISYQITLNSEFLIDNENCLASDE
jgi:hypothetical protein